MIIVLAPRARRNDADEILRQIAEAGLKPLYLPGVERTVIGALGDERILASLHFENNPVVERVTPILTPYKIVSREMHRADTIVSIGDDVPIGGRHFAVIAGPCAVESLGQLRAAAQAVKASGAQCLRAGAYKPRSSPYSFQGLGAEGLPILRRIARETGLPAVTEVIDAADVEHVSKYASALQIGARNMQNFRLLAAVGHSRLPVILKRGMSATIEELLLAAEYIVAAGNPNVILCERGIRTFETATRNTLDLNAVPFLKQHSHLPVLVDPSHGTGLRELVLPMSRAAIGAGADGLMIEVHPDPKSALSDGRQSLSPLDFDALMRDIRPFVAAAGKIPWRKSPKPVPAARAGSQPKRRPRS